MTQKLKTIIPLILITLCGFGLRLYQIDSNPPSLNWDEVSHGYNAYSIFKTGRDEWGEKFPLIFRAFGDYKLPGYIYFSVIPIALLGLSTLSVRLISILAGSLAVPLIYFLTNKLFPKTILEHRQIKINTGHLSAIIMCLLPWHFFISRPALEANLALTLIIAGFIFLFKALESPKYYLLATIFLSLSLHTYNSARIFVPILILVWFFLYRKQIDFKPVTLISILILFLSLGLIFYQILTGAGTARYSKLSILSESAVYQIGQDRLNSQLSPPLAKLIHNRPVYFVGQFIPKYLSYFSPNFFRQSIGANYQFAIPNVNMITIPVSILLIIGLIFTFLKIRDPNNKFILSWFFLSPLAASLTVDYPHALRTCIMIPPLVIIASLGWSMILKPCRKVCLIIISILIIISFGNYFSTYFNQYRKDYSDSWQYGYKEIISYVNQEASNYKNIFITKKIGEPHIYYAFYNQISPTEIWPGPNNIRFEKSNWFWTDKINNIYFINSWDIPDKTKADTLELESGPQVNTKESLLITTPDRVPSNTRVVKVINYLDNNPAFIIAKFSE